MCIFVGRLLPTPSHTRMFTPPTARSGGPPPQAAAWVPTDSDKEPEAEAEAEARSQRHIHPGDRAARAPATSPDHKPDGSDRLGVAPFPRLSPASGASGASAVPAPLPALASARVHAWSPEIPSAWAAEPAGTVAARLMYLPPIQRRADRLSSVHAARVGAA